MHELFVTYLNLKKISTLEVEKLELKRQLEHMQRTSIQRDVDHQEPRVA